MLTWFDQQLAGTALRYGWKLLPPPPPAGRPFADVPTNKDSEMGDAVYFLDRAGLLNGYPDQTLGLGRPITRREFDLLRGRLVRWMEREISRLGSATVASPGGAVEERRNGR